MSVRSEIQVRLRFSTPPRSNRNHTDRAPFSFDAWITIEPSNGGIESMNRKIIIHSDDFDKEIFIFLREVVVDMPIEWDYDAIGRIRDTVIDALKKMGIVLEIDARLESSIGRRLAKG